jgi:hypothetical protein
MMDLDLLINFFSQNVFTHLPATVYSAQLIARTILGILNKIGFNFETFTQLLAKANVKLQKKLVEELLEVATKGVDELSEWIRDKFQSPEIVQAAGEIIATQAEEIGTAFDEAVKDPEKRKSVAKKADESLKEVGGITDNIPVDFATVLLDPDRRAELVGMLQKELGVHPIQEQIAEAHSKIISSKQHIEGYVDATQRQKATDHSTISNSEQSIRVIRDDQSKTGN